MSKKKLRKQRQKCNITWGKELLIYHGYKRINVKFIASGQMSYDCNSYQL